MNRPFRFSPSRVALGYVALGVVALASFAVPLWYGWRVNISTFRAYVQGEDVQRLVDIFDREGAPALVTAMESQAGSLPDDQIMVLADASKRRLAGSLPAWPAEVPDAPGTYGLVIGVGGGATMRVVASHIRLPGGYHFLIGRESVRFESLVERFWYGIAGAMGVVLALGAVIGWMIRRALLAEVDEISRTASAIAAGDLSRRVTARGKSDELDALARSVNGMLEQLARQNQQLEREITVRRQAEQALHRAHDDLEALVAQRTGQLAQANESLRRSETYLAEAQRLSLTGSFGWNLSREELFWSKETFCILGYDEATKPTLARVLERVHPEDRDFVQQTFDQASRDGTNVDFEHRLLFPDGSVKNLHVIAHAVEAQSGAREYVGAVSDVSAAKRAEEKLRQSERELQQLVDIVPQHIFVLDPDGSRVYSNQVAREYHGLSPKDPAADHLAMFVHPDDVESAVAERQRLIARGSAYEMEVRLRGKDGQYRWFLIRGNPLRDEQGSIIRWYGTRTDIEDRKRAEEKLRQDERELRRITDAIPQAISVLAPDGKILYANEVVLDYTGVSLEDVKAEDFRARLFHPDDLERFGEERQQALLRGEPFEVELRARRKDGQYRWFLVRYHPLRDDEGRIIRWYATGIDIDDRKQAEERVQKENLALREEIDHSSMFEEIVGSSAALRKVLAQVAKVAPVDSTVLILGETGTGKELIARAIHKRSKRSSRAFIRVNCAAIPQSLIASELFGHEKGAFTGALQRRLGRFELADGGTIFLDEIGELPAETQIALLRVLQEGELERVGSGQTISVNVRVLGATNRDLEAAVAAGTFRQDLFYRLNVFPIQMPSLRERVDDIPLLVEYFIERYAKKAGKKIRNIRKQTSELFQAYDWPGNIRELQNVIERAVVLCDSDSFAIDESWLKRDGQRPPGAVPFVATLVEREKEIIETVLAECHGQVAGTTGAAAKLGIPRQTLESKIKSLRIDKHRFKARQVT
ncbi:MAG: sigma 54-interacting transcriptional regulator [Candidatus Binatota bacterium]|nr:sigma 54-interacting transcriptional regulator [Candidatus Binatota bacterium]